jgi:hypothetical protein
MLMNTQEAVLSAYIASIGKRSPRDAGSRPRWNARAWSSTTSTAIREATPCTSICPMALTTASADGNAATASGGEPCTTA